MLYRHRDFIPMCSPGPTEGRSTGLSGLRPRLTEWRHRSITYVKESLVIVCVTYKSETLGVYLKTTTKNTGRPVYPYKNDTLVRVTVSRSHQYDLGWDLVIRVTIVTCHGCSTMFGGIWGIWVQLFLCDVSHGTSRRTSIKSFCRVRLRSG